MENAREALKTLGFTLDKYRLNKTKVPKAELEGRYKVPFQKLKERLKGEAEAYLKAYALSGIKVSREDGGWFLDAANKGFVEGKVGERAGRALFTDFSLQGFQAVADGWRQQIQELYAEYLSRHGCLYVAEGCFGLDNPQTPLIYNDIVDKFYDDAADRWINREKPPGAAILIFISEKGEKRA